MILTRQSDTVQLDSRKTIELHHKIQPSPVYLLLQPVVFQIDPLSIIGKHVVFIVSFPNIFFFFFFTFSHYNGSFVY